ncbi:ABC transporter ATP-binding protein [Ancylobacter dichloromethanicus]|uniref:ABC transporter permease n=1 Tax=Ancylobacter dichloromethanicus TaxID=518825 RepID=A0A9W6JBR6_9HYPH|nr:ABC transporter ATP-binding protein [Ancylobacter dichloromethanicus]MBS7553649.1 ABC transporter ATP-binding protein [Ancylobacter dichloromethanicus]GLK72713.1 ABC transporter permease [Ancylobacter dichloromethanicus]
MSRAPLDTALLAAFLRALAESARGRGALSVAAIVGGALAESVGLVLLVPVLQVLTGREGRVAAWFEGWNPDGVLLLLLGGFLVAMTLRALILYARDRLLWRVEDEFVEAQRGRIMARLASARWATLVSIRHAEIQNVLSTEMARLAMTMRFFVQIAVGALLVLVQGGLALYMAPVLAGSLLVAVAIAGAAFSGLRHAGVLGHDFTRASLNQLQAVGNLLSGLKAALAQNLQSRFAREFEQALAAARANRRGFARRQARTRMVFAIGSAACACLVVAIGSLVLQVPTPVLILLVLIFARLAGPIATLQQALQQFAYHLPAFGAVMALDAQLEATGAGAPAVPQDVPEGSVELREVRLRYVGGGGVEHVDLVIAPGERVALSGASGSGKTTLLDALAGLMVPDSGELRVAGVVLDAAATPAWREHVAYVVQEPYLFRDTVRANVAGESACGDGAVWEALERVGAAALVRRMERGLDTVIGAGGTPLSGGERQRLALARALLRRPRLLMLDEATNAIDLPSERLLLQRLAEIDPRPALLMVTHRRDNLDLFDRVLEMREGRLYAESPHAAS